MKNVFAVLLTVLCICLAAVLSCDDDDDDANNDTDDDAGDNETDDDTESDDDAGNDDDDDSDDDADDDIGDDAPECDYESFWVCQVSSPGLSFDCQEHNNCGDLYPDYCEMAHCATDCDRLATAKRISCAEDNSCFEIANYYRCMDACSLAYLDCLEPLASCDLDQYTQCNTESSDCTWDCP